MNGETESITERLSKTRGVRDFHLVVTSHSPEEAQDIPGVQDESRRQRKHRVG